jgi:hypothetical protein
MRTVAKYFGILLIAVSFIGTLFFRHYTGEIIAYPFLWYIAFGALGLTGLILIYTSTNGDDTETIEIYRQTLAKIKASSRRIVLDFDKCDFKNGSYARQVEDPEMSTLKWVLPHEVSLYMDTTKTETLTQSYLVYRETYAGEQRRFISYPFPFDKTTLEYYVMTKKLALYVDRFDKKKYYFDLER